MTQLATAGLFGGLQTGLAVFGALDHNSRTRAALDALRRSAILRQSAIAAEAGRRLDENRRAAARLLGMIRTLRAGGDGGDALVRQAAIDAKRNSAAIALDASFKHAALREEYRSQGERLAQSTISPILAALSGATSGVVSGLQLGGQIEDAMRAGGEPEPPPSIFGPGFMNSPAMHLPTAPDTRY